MIAERGDENLGLGFQPPEAHRMDDAVAVTLKTRCAARAVRRWPRAPIHARHGRAGRQRRGARKVTLARLGQPAPRLNRNRCKTSVKCA